MPVLITPAIGPRLSATATASRSKVPIDRRVEQELILPFGGTALVEVAPFDLAEFASWIDRRRVDSGLTWVGLARRVGVAASTIRRFAVATDAEADGVLALVGWLGVSPEDFVVNSSVAGSPLPLAGDGLIRVDMGLLAALPSWPGSDRIGCRTTIQQLVAAGQGSCRMVASQASTSSEAARTGSSRLTIL